MVRIIIAEDHRLLREGFKGILSRRPDFLVVGEAGDGGELLDMLKQAAAADCLIVDISMPGLGGIEAIREIRKTDRNVRILVLTMHREEDLLCQAFLAGADWYLLKDDVTRELFKAIDTILESSVYVSPFFVKGLEDSWLKVFIASKGASAGEPLSAQEMEILRHLAARESSAEIAGKMSIPPAAVAQLRGQILEKLRMEKPANHAELPA